LAILLAEDLGEGHGEVSVVLVDNDLGEPVRAGARELEAVASEFPHELAVANEVEVPVLHGTTQEGRRCFSVLAGSPPGPERAKVGGRAVFPV